MWTSPSFFRTSPFADLERMRREMDSLFNQALARPGIRTSLEAFPPVSVAETGEDVRVFLFAPGMNAKDFDLSIQGNVLTLTATRKNEQEKERWTCYRNERQHGSFTRVITLPETVDGGQVHAAYENGILGVYVSKKAEVQPRKIPVKVG
jgi:HSP20 family protein